MAGLINDALGGALRGMAAISEKEALRHAAEDAAQGLLTIYMSSKNRELAKSCRATLELLCNEFGPDESGEPPCQPIIP